MTLLRLETGERKEGRQWEGQSLHLSSSNLALSPFVFFNDFFGGAHCWSSLAYDALDSADAVFLAAHSISFLIPRQWSTPSCPDWAHLTLPGEPLGQSLGQLHILFLLRGEYRPPLPLSPGTSARLSPFRSLRHEPEPSLTPKSVLPSMRGEHQ